MAAGKLAAPIAYSYQRVSSGPQVGGHGLHRQADTAERWCLANGYRLDTHLDLCDRGRSAYSGKHLKGALGRFLERAQQGQLGTSPVLLVEAVDRLSRQEPLEAVDTILRGLVGSGVKVITLEDQAEYSRETLASDPSRLLVLVVKIQAAHEFSRRNGMRSKANWAKRYQAAINGKKDPSPRCRPYWLDWDSTAQDFTTNDRVAMVCRAFELSCEGLGTNAIAIKLTAEGHRNTSGKAIGGGTITALMRDRRVLGERLITDPEGNQHTLQGYFPAVVPAELFERSLALCAARDTAAGSNRFTATIRNIFNGVLFCPCEARLHHMSSHQRKYQHLVCSFHVDRRCTAGQGWIKYDEEALLRSFMTQRWAAFFDRPAVTQERQTLERQQLELERLLGQQEQQASNAQRNLGQLLQQGQLDASTAAMLGKAAQDAQAAAAATQGQLEQVRASLTQLLAMPTGRELQRQVRDQVRQFLSSDRNDLEQRQRFNGWLRTLGVRLTLQLLPDRRWVLVVEQLQKVKHDAEGGVTVAGAEFHIGSPALHTAITSGG